MLEKGLGLNSLEEEFFASTPKDRPYGDTENVDPKLVKDFLDKQSGNNSLTPIRDIRNSEIAKPYDEPAKPQKEGAGGIAIAA